jgi:hypothetical protein
MKSRKNANDLALRYRPGPSSCEPVLEEAARLEANLVRSGLKSRIRGKDATSAAVSKRIIANPLPHALATINPANIATPALESHQHPQFADPVCHDSGSVTSVTLWQARWQRRLMVMRYD